MKQQWRNLIWIFVLCSGTEFGVSMAQDQVFPNCQQTLKQSPEAFLKSHPSNDPQDAGAGLHWASCKEKQNAQLLRGHPKLAVHIKQLSDLEDEFMMVQDTLTNLKMDHSVHNYFLIYANIKQHLGTLIQLTVSGAGSVTNPSVQARYAQAKLELDSRVARVITNPQPHVSPGPNPDRATGFMDIRLQFWKYHAAQYKKVYRKILALIGSKQDAASLEVLEFLNTSLSAKEL
jgi:hypothetical protein